MFVGFVFGILIELKLFLRSGLVFLVGKLWVLMDFFILLCCIVEDEFFGYMIECCFGLEVFENLIEFLFVGIYVGDMCCLSF